MLNKCDECGKFRAWSQLISVEEKSLDVTGGLQQKDYLVCIPCQQEFRPLGIKFTVQPFG